MTFDVLTDPVQEKSFWALLGKLRLLPRSRRASVVTAAWSLVVAASAGCSSATAADLGKLVRDCTATGFAFAMTILGIIIAGFAIFTTIATSPLVKQFGSQRSSIKPLTTLKYMALHFVDAFVPFVAFCLFGVIVMTLGWVGGPVTSLANLLPVAVARWLAAVLLGLVSGALVALLDTLKDFIFNIYTAFMTIAAGSMTLDEFPELKDVKPSALASINGLDGEESLEAASTPGARVEPGSETVAEELEEWDDATEEQRHAKELRRFA